MPDISMCRNEKCTLKETCYRYKAKPSDFWQSYTEFVQKEDGTCNNHLEIYKKKKK